MQRKRHSAQQKFNGPVSFSARDEESNTETQSTDHLSVFDKALQGKLKPVKNNAPNIYGCREDFENTMIGQSTKKSNANRGYLPTPPSEVQKRQVQCANQFSPALNGAAASLVTQVTKPAWTPRTSSKTVESTPEPDESKKPYIPRDYKAGKSSAPYKDVLGNRLSRQSGEAELWSFNQQESPFLKLPAEVRNRIYAEVLPGGNTIKIDYATYQHHGNGMLVPVFKYNYTIFANNTGPYKFKPDQWNNIGGYTLLSGICRQLYLETAALPFKQNTIAFGSHNIMTNFILFEQRFSRLQRHAITKLLLRDTLPGANILKYLPHLQEVLLYTRLMVNSPRGHYRVIRTEGEEPKLERIWLC
ncbi:hypothetical protein BDU57DRAFT_455638 [Ampelomyces quisqualis]|uniref:DUF7730 domain-containing protein n=1 Tax=Ampelomyces quisqualis TaxID=50730 RepID=A0A6A5QGP3_AMPQU|nr:hypothetical protein BDU57DRAFT_455638 [Ampelomyces quisqualis]